VLLAACALMLAHLHYTGMRAGWLALGGAAAVYMLALALRRFTKRGDRFPVVMLGTLLACAAVGVGGLAYALQAWPNARLDIDSSWILRLNGYLGSTELFFDHPWTGTGPGTFRDAIVPYWTDFEQRWFILYNMRNNHAHNELLEAAVEAGLPGLAATLLLFITVQFSTLQLATSPHTYARRLGLMLFVAFIAMLIDAQFGFNLHTPAAAGLFFLLVGLVISLQRIELAGTPLVPSPPPMTGTPDQGVTLGERVGLSASGGVRGQLPTLLLVLSALLLLTASTAGYYTAWKFQRSRGAQQWAATQENTRPDLADQALGMALLDLEEVCRYPFATVTHWDALAQMRATFGQKDEAAEAYRQAIARAPYDPALNARAANFLLDSYDDPTATEEARLLAEAALTFCKNLADAHYALGRVGAAKYAASVAEGKPDKKQGDVAVEQYVLATQYAPEQKVSYWLAMAETCDSTQRHAALAWAAILQPWNKNTWEQLAASPDGQDILVAAACDAYAEARRTLPAPLYLADLAVLSESQGTHNVNYLRDALNLLPMRTMLWGNFILYFDKGERSYEIEQLRLTLGECDPDTERALAPMYALFDAADAQDFSRTSKALEVILEFITQVRNIDMDTAREDWGWTATYAVDAVRGWNVSQDLIAPALLRAAHIHDRVEAFDRAESLAGEAEPLLSGPERGGALLLLSEAEARRGNGAESLRLAQQAATLAPFALPVRWNLARRLHDAGRTAEAEFEFSSQLNQLDLATPDGKSMAKEYEDFQAATLVPGTVQ
jgi:tetratricopeptide (TPR) repeat protein